MSNLDSLPSVGQAGSLSLLEESCFVQVGGTPEHFL